MALLAPYGYQEAELREHSLDWVKTLNDTHRKRLRAEMADQLALMALAAAAPQSQEATEQVQETVAELRGEEDAAGYLTNKDAKTDWEALAPFLTRQPAKEDPNGREG